MTESTIVVDKQVSSDQDDFDAIFEEISDKTDEEVAELQAKEEAKESDGTGESTEDQTKIANPESDKSADDKTSNPNAGLGQDKVPATETTSDVTDLKMEIDALKAELQKEKQRTASWDGRIRSANEKVKTLEAENATLRSEAGKVKQQLEQAETGKKTELKESDAEIKAKFESTFPELVEILDMYQRNMSEKMPTPAKEEIKAEPKAEEKPAAETTAAKEAPASESTHLDDVRKVHAELDEIVSTGVLLTWINKQVESIRPHLTNIYHGQNDQGSTQQVIDLITNFKLKTSWKSQLETGQSAQDDKLKSMLEAEGESPGPKSEGPDMDNFDEAAKEAFK